jgi:hypothetical protein
MLLTVLNRDEEVANATVGKGMMTSRKTNAMLPRKLQEGCNGLACFTVKVRTVGFETRGEELVALGYWVGNVDIIDWFMARLNVSRAKVLRVWIFKCFSYTGNGLPLSFLSPLFIAVLEDSHLPFQPLICPHCISSLGVNITVQEQLA